MWRFGFKPRSFIVPSSLLVLGCGTLDHRFLEEGNLVIKQEQPLQAPNPPVEETTATPISIISLILDDFAHWLAAVVAAIGDAAFSLLIPKVVGSIIQSLSDNHGGAGDFVVLGCLILGKAVCSYIASVEVRRACENFAARLKEEVFKALLSQDIAFHDSTSLGELLSLISSDVRDLKHTLGDVLVGGVRSAFTLIGGVFMLYSTSAKLTLVLCGTIPLWMGAGTVVANVLKTKLKHVRDLDAKSQGQAQEVLQHIRTVRAFGTEETELQKYSQQIRNVRDQYHEINVILGGFHALGGITVSAFTALSLFAGSYWDTTLNAGKIGSFLMTATSVQFAFAQLSMLAGELNRSSTSAERVFDYVNRKPKILDTGGLTLPRKINGNIEFQDVSFSYPSRPNDPVFENLSLEIPQGKATAIVGSSGAGKTTLSLLLLRFYDTSSGNVLIDGIPIKELDSKSLRSKIGVVEQRPLLFSGTIFENICYGYNEASEEDIYEAAKVSGCHEFVMKLDNGYQTQVGENGVQLSGGQLQRLAMARALIRKPSILILDEATSNLDTLSESLIQTAIDNIKGDITTLIIAHRLSTVQNSDKIVVLDHGKVIEEGSHYSLMEKRGAYYDLMKAQE